MGTTHAGRDRQVWIVAAAAFVGAVVVFGRTLKVAVRRGAPPQHGGGRSGMSYEFDHASLVFIFRHPDSRRFFRVAGAGSSTQIKSRSALSLSK